LVFAAKLVQTRQAVDVQGSLPRIMSHIVALSAGAWSRGFMMSSILNPFASKTADPLNLVSSQLSYSMLQRCFAVGSKQKRTSAEAPFGGKQLPCNEGIT